MQLDSRRVGCRHNCPVEDALSSTDANYYSLLLVSLLEHGAPMTLPQVAARFDAAGVAPAPDALASLKRCKPGRAPIYRDGDAYAYALDPHDDEVSFWLFRLGLRPPRVAPLQAVPPARGPLPSSNQPLTMAALDEAWRDGPNALRCLSWIRTTPSSGMQRWWLSVAG
ncbi:MAG: hypothetical protein OEW19_12980 [Acidobacteriota bacterium]|nr:hypothetical protein [Acidobacteriota bacterium]